MDEPDNSFDFFGMKTLAKISDKTITKLLDGLGEFFKLICAPAAEEVGLYLRDKISYYRIVNLYKISEKLKKKAKSRNLQFTGYMQPRLLKEISEEASWCEDDIIQEMWAGLITESSTNAKSNDDSLIYVDYLKRITSFQARLLNKIYSDPRACSVRQPISFVEGGRYNPENELVYRIETILNLYPGDLSSFVPIENITHEKIIVDSTNHGIALGRFKPQIENLKALNLVHDIFFLPGPTIKVKFIPNEFGLDFYMRCLGYSVYPLEAFILTLQHWNLNKNIDPFSYTDE